MKYFQQWNSEDCGPACFAMIASSFNLYISLADIRKIAGTDKLGTNIAGIVKVSNEYGLKANPLKANDKQRVLLDNLPVPFMVLVNSNENKDELQTNHFVVVKKINKTNIEIWDPESTVGKHKLNIEEFLLLWSGYAIFFRETTEFKTKKKVNSFIRFIPILYPHKKTIFSCIAASFLMMLLGIIISFYYKYLFDDVLFSEAYNTLTALSVGVVVVTITQAIIGAFRDLVLNIFSLKIEIQLHFSFINQILKLPLFFFETRETGDIMSRLSDIDKIRDTFSKTAISSLMDIITVFFVTPLLFIINKTLFFISFDSVLIMSIIVFLFSKIFKNLYTKVWSEDTIASSYLYEVLNGAMTVKSLHSEDSVYNEYDCKKTKAIWTRWKISKYSVIQGFINCVVQNVSSILIFWFGSMKITDNSITLGTLISFNALLIYFTGPLFRLVNLQPTIQDSMLAAERVSEILDLDQEKDNKKLYLQPISLFDNIVFKNIFFRYGSHRLLYKDLSLTIKKGEWTAFVGPSGSGKTTLVKLIMGLYIPEEGNILIGGNNLKDIDINILRSHIGYVPQEIFLFSGTIAQNISMSTSDIDMKSVIGAAEKAGAAEFIENLPDRYNTKIGERGVGLSGGEKQRLALARALIKNPDILILDEATSNLDLINEKNVHKAIQKLRGKDITVIIIAHRLTSITSCDNIFVMENGKIIQSGKHKELLIRDGIYKNMWMGINEYN